MTPQNAVNIDKNICNTNKKSKATESPTKVWACGQVWSTDKSSTWPAYQSVNLLEVHPPQKRATKTKSRRVINLCVYGRSGTRLKLTFFLVCDVEHHFLQLDTAQNQKSMQNSAVSHNSMNG